MRLPAQQCMDRAKLSFRAVYDLPGLKVRRAGRRARQPRYTAPPSLHACTRDHRHSFIIDEHTFECRYLPARDDTRTTEGT